MSDEKVYCSRCKYLMRVDYGGPAFYYCEHPKNETVIAGDSWLEKRTVVTHAAPEFLNASNNCQRFELKEEDKDGQLNKKNA